MTLGVRVGGRRCGGFVGGMALTRERRHLHTELTNEAIKFPLLKYGRTHVQDLPRLPCRPAPHVVDLKMR